MHKESRTVFRMKGVPSFASFCAFDGDEAAVLSRECQEIFTAKAKNKGSAYSSGQSFWIGAEETRQQVRLIEVLFRGKWYRYLTNELEC